MIIFLLTGNIRDGNFDQADLFARVLLLVCMFLISHTLIMLLRFFKDQAEAAAKSETMEKLLEIQSDQYSLLTADNTSSGSPNWSGDKLLSTKHSGYGIGTESIRMIAERYSGDARFMWKDGIFYASVMLNPQV